MTIYQMNRPNPCLITMKFKTYNEAIDFSSKSGMMKATKPYKRMLNVNGDIMPVWCVTLPQTKPQEATYKKAA